MNQYIRRKLGVSHGLTALTEWAGAKINNAATAIDVGIEEELDYRLGQSE